MPCTTSGSLFTSPPKEGVLRIFIALKNASNRPGLNPRPLGPVAYYVDDVLGCGFVHLYVDADVSKKHAMLDVCNEDKLISKYRRYGCS
jgi:hypothetical protein